MFKALKVWKLTGDLKRPGNAPEAFAAVVQLGALGGEKAVDLLLSALDRHDGKLKLRDETTPERQAELEKLRHAANLALHKVGDPFAAKARSATPDAMAAALAKVEEKLGAVEVHPKLIGDLSLVTDGELIGVLREVISASEEVSWANLESREPMLAAWFKTYDLRAGIARTVGEELHRRGGTSLMRQVFERDLNGYTAIGNWWSGIGNWQ